MPKKLKKGKRNKFLPRIVTVLEEEQMAVQPAGNGLVITFKVIGLDDKGIKWEFLRAERHVMSGAPGNIKVNIEKGKRYSFVRVG